MQRKLNNIYITRKNRHTAPQTIWGCHASITVEATKRVTCEHSPQKKNVDYPSHPPVHFTQSSFSPSFGVRQTGHMEF